jgi:hypothetical protein
MALVLGSCSAALASLLTGTFLVFALSFVFFSLSGGVYAQLLPSLAHAMGAMEKVAVAEFGAMVAWEKVDWKSLVQGAALVFGWNALLGGILLVYQWSAMSTAANWGLEGLKRLRNQVFGSSSNRWGEGLFSALLNLSPIQLQLPSLLPGTSNLATVTLLFSLYMKFGKEIKTCASYLVSKVLKKTREEEEEEAGEMAESHPLKEEFIGRSDLQDLKRRIQSLESQQERESGQSQSNHNHSHAAWKHLSHKQSAQLSSHQWVRSNGEEGNRLLNCPESSGLQMLVKTSFEGVDWRDVADFWINDDFRGNWDRCFVSSESVLETQDEEDTTGTSSSSDANRDKYNSKGVEVVRWVRKFPAFCSNREYIIARRSFYEEETKSVYVVSKSVDYDMPPQIKRVKEYYSSWRIRLVPSPQCPGKMAVETVLLHYEDLGVPNSIFRLAMRTFFGWFITGLESNGLREFIRQKKEGLLKNGKNGKNGKKATTSKKQEEAVVNENESGRRRSNGLGRWGGRAAVLAMVLLTQRKRGFRLQK